jgi:predicted RND superfamily exporter protein
MIYMALFGATLQVCRIVTVTLWTGIGFHLTFLELSRYLVGPQHAVVSLHDTAPIALLAYPVLFVFAGLGLLGWAWTTRRSRSAGALPVPVRG